MKAALYQGIHNIEITEMADYKCGDDGIILKNIYSGICGTDVAVYNHGTGLGHRITVGAEFGHETVCRVSAVGKNVTDVKVGDRVYPYPLLVTGDKKRAGTIGIAAAIALKCFGCEQVVICDYSDYRLNICKELGFTVYNNKSDEELLGLMDITGKSMGVNGEAVDCDIWIDAAGADSVLNSYEKYGKYDSRMVMVAVGTNKREVDILGLTFGQKSITGSGGYTPQDVEDVLNIMKSGKWDIGKMITHEFAIDDLSKAIEKASDVDNALNIVVNFE